MKPLMPLGLLAALMLVLCAPAWAAPSCAALAPSSNPDENYKTIVACLSSLERNAHLVSGVFPVSRKIKMQAGSTLSGSSETVIKAVDGNAHYKDNMIIELTGMNLVKDVAFVGDGRLKPGCCTTIVGISGSGSRVESTDISDEDASHRASEGEEIRVAGLYFLGAPDSGNNVGSNLRIHGLNFGVIFRKGLVASANNRVAGSDIFDLSCDAFSFAGGGIADGNHLHETGYDCKQHPVPIPGGGFYALNNNEPVVISNNTITDICGVGFDIVGSRNFQITGNKFSQQNAPFGGRYPYCSGYPAKLVDVSNFTVRNNVFYVSDAPPIGIAFKFFPAFRHATAAYYDLVPNSMKQIYALRLVRQTSNVVGNRFENNRMIAQCSPGGPCAGGGVGLFVGPGVGDTEPNIFVKNTFIGTDVAAVRCGHDRYVSNRVCRTGNAKGDCRAEAEAEKSAREPQTNDICPVRQ